MKIYSFYSAAGEILQVVYKINCKKKKPVLTWPYVKLALLIKSMKRPIFFISSVALLSLSLQSCAFLIPVGIIGAASFANDNRSLGMQVDDNIISPKLKQAIRSSFGDEEKDISVDVMEGRALLSGCLKNLRNKSKITKVAWSVRGVREVINELKYCPSLTGSDKAKDSMIEGQIKARMLIEKNVSSPSYVVSCINREIYIMGVASNEKEKAKVLSIVKSTSSVKSITSHIILKNDPRRWNRT